MSKLFTSPPTHLIGYAVAFLLGVGTMLLSQWSWHYLHSSPGSIPTDYETCAQQPDSRILEIYPPQCVTKDGQRFTQQNVKEEIPVTDLPGQAEPNEGAAFTCPAKEWVDCMPGPDQGVRQECSPEFLTWAQNNCPGFQGAAY